MPCKTCMSKLSLSCTDKTSEFHVSRLEWVLSLQGGFSDTCFYSEVIFNLKGRHNRRLLSFSFIAIVTCLELQLSFVPHN